jgi:hypothetical protein
VAPLDSAHVSQSGSLGAAAFRSVVEAIAHPVWTLRVQAIVLALAAEGRGTPHTAVPAAASRRPSWAFVSTNFRAIPMLLSRLSG